MKNITQQIDKQNWWKIRSSKYNKGLVIAGVITIVITALLFYFFNKSVHESIAVLYIGTPVYLLYIGTLNVIFFILEAADRQFPNRVDNNTKDILFGCFYWLTLGLPFVYPVFIVSLFWIY